VVIPSSIVAVAVIVVEPTPAPVTVVEKGAARSGVVTVAIPVSPETKSALSIVPLFSSIIVTNISVDEFTLKLTSGKEIEQESGEGVGVGTGDPGPGVEPPAAQQPLVVHIAGSEQLPPDQIQFVSNPDHWQFPGDVLQFTIMLIWSHWPM
jgi:hypothetical protein